MDGDVKGTKQEEGRGWDGPAPAILWPRTAPVSVCLSVCVSVCVCLLVASSDHSRPEAGADKTLIRRQTVLKRLNSLLTGRESRECATTRMQTPFDLHPDSWYV